MDRKTAQRLHDLLSERVDDIVDVEDEDGEMAEMGQPVLTEWVLVANVIDISSDEPDCRITVLSAPNMLHTHVIGLLTVARAL
jgi:hypothetical protein